MPNNLIKKLWLWIKEGKFLFIFIFLIVLIFFLRKLGLSFKLEHIIRVYGLILQLIGTFTLIVSLTGKMILFKEYGLFKFISDYIRRFPLFKQKKRIAHLQADTGSFATVMGKARIVKKAKEDFQDIIRYFEEEIEYLHKRLQEDKVEMKNHLDNIKADIEIFKKHSDQEVIKTKKLIEKSSLSNIWLDAFGIGCIILGLILATIPDIVECALLKI